MKKLLLGLGTLASVAAPVAAVIACGSGTNDSNVKVITGESDHYAEYSQLAKEISAKLPVGIKDNATYVDKIESDGTNVTFTYSDQDRSAVADEAADVTVSVAPNFAKVSLNLSTKKITNVDTRLGEDSDWIASPSQVVDGLNADKDIADAIEAANKVINPEPVKPVDTTPKGGDTSGGDTSGVDATAKAAAAKAAAALASDKTTEIAKINGKLVSLIDGKLVEASDLPKLTTLHTAIQTAIDTAIQAVNAAQTPDELKAVSTTDIETAVTAYEKAEKAATEAYATAHFATVKDAGADAIKARTSELLAADYATGDAKAAYDAFIQEITTQAAAVRGSSDADDYKTKNAAAKTAIDNKKAAAIAAKALQEQKTTAIKQLLDVPTALTAEEIQIADLKTKFEAIKKAQATADINAAADKASMETIVETYNNLVKAFPAARAAATATTATVTAEAADDTSITVDVTIKTDDFKNHIDGLIAKAIATKLGKDFDAKAGKLKSLTVKITDEDGKTVTKTQSVVNVAGEAVASKIYSRINTAIDMVSEAIAKDPTLGHDTAMSATDYVSKMEARIDAIDMSGDAVQDANNILVAVGNASVFSATAYKPVFAAEVATKDPKAKVAELLAPYLAAEASHGDIVTKLQAQIDKIGA